MRRFVAAYFRHPFLLVIPAIIIPIIVVFVVRSLASTYESDATIIVTNSLIKVPNGNNPYLSPADNLNNKLSDALNSNSFILQIAKATDMPKTYKPGTPGIDSLMISRISSGLTITTLGDNTLDITYDDSNPRVAAEVITAFLNQYIVAQVQQAQSNQQQSLQILNQQLTQDNNAVQAANTDLQNYLAQHPTADPTTDSTLAQYETAYKQALDNYNYDLSSIQDINAQTYLLENVVTFEVSDPPYIPAAPTVKSKTTITAAVAGVSLGLGVSLGIIGLMAILDRRIYSSDDLSEVLPVPVLEVLPRLRGLQHDQPIVESEENLLHLSNVPVLAILPSSTQSTTTPDSTSTFSSRVEEK